MMAFIRKHSQGFFAKMLMVFVLISFVAWGIGDIPSIDNSKNIASVDGAPISDLEYKRELEQLKESFGEHYSPQLMKELNLYQTKLNQLVDQKIIDLEAQRVGLRISDESLVAYIAKESIFQNSVGSFDKKIFTQVLKQNNLSEREYMRIKRQQIAAELLRSTFEIHPNVSQDYLQRLYQIRNIQRQVSLILVNKPKDLSPFYGVAPSQDQIDQYYDSHKNNYLAPEYRTIQYIEINPKSINDKIAITEKDAMDEYQSRTTDFVVAQKRDLAQLLYATKPEAEQAYKALRDGKTIADVAKAIVPKNKDALDIGSRTKAQMSEGADEVFGVQEGGVTPPIQSAFGWHVFQVKKIEKEHTADFATVRKSIEDSLRQDKANTMLNEMIEHLEDTLSASGNLETAAKETNLKLMKATNIDAQGLSASNKTIFPADKYQDLLAKAFGLNAGGLSNIFSTKDGRQYVIKLVSITPSKPHALADIKDALIEDMRREVAITKIHDNAQNLAKDLKTSSSAQLTALLQKYHAESQIATVVGRNGIASKEDKKAPKDAKKATADDKVAQDSADAKAAATKTDSTAEKVEKKDPRLATALPAEMLDALFTMEKTGDYTTAFPYNDGFIIARMDKAIAAPDVKTTEGKRLFEALEVTTANERKNEVMTAFLSELRKRYHVEVYPKILNTIVQAELATTKDATP
jgi:peptidyl-prolyl cis-trans isomerase D